MHRTAWAVWIMAAVALGASRDATASTVGPGTNAASESLLTIEKALIGPYTQAAFVIANSASDWDAAMDSLDHAGALQVTPPPPAPAGIDWGREVVILAASGFSGNDVTLELTPVGNASVALGALWTPLGNDASWAMPYHLVRTIKRGWLHSQVVVGANVGTALPISGADDVPDPALSVSWGSVKALYH